jgi:endonuclease YncB( thermonuclease family)
MNKALIWGVMAWAMATGLFWGSTASAMVPAAWPGKVLEVVSGDILIVVRPDNVPVKIRIAEIDCPSLDQPWGKQARRFTMARVKGRELSIVPGNLTADGMVVARVELPGGVSLGEELLRAGLAWCWEHSRDPYLAQIQKEAYKYKRGLWSEPHPIPPWEWQSR